MLRAAEGGRAVTEDKRMGAGREEFLAWLAGDFPDVVAGFGPYSEGLLYCEVADFRKATERAMDADRLGKVEQHFRLVAEFLSAAGPEIQNALEVSYLEDLALGEFTPSRYHAIKERMPPTLLQVLIGHHSHWR